jgi:two-component system, sensor histidine kinase and response regulator
VSHDTKKTVVIVDDTPENLRLLAQILSEQGYRVRSAPNGERALATVQKERPDLILLDIVMPEMDGFEVCRLLKEDERYKDIPIIFISALNEVFDKVAAFSIGAVDYITKPFQIEEVLARVHTHLTLVEMRETLQAQNQQLHDQNHELEAFAHTVAHDLKSPLAVLVGSLELMRSDADPANEQAQKMLGISANAAHKMNNIIDELLLLASIRKEEIQTAPLEMGGIVNQALSRLTHMVDRYHPEVIIPDMWPSACGYAPWVEEVWVNYLSNGVKYGGQPPILELGAVEQSGYVSFFVKDNGPGLDPEAQSRLFTEFTRLDKVRAQGHGLGLSIVRRIMGKLDGGFGVESTPGEGSIFYFTLPMN